MKKNILFLCTIALIAGSAFAEQSYAYEMVLGRAAKKTNAFNHVTADDIPRVMILRTTPALIQRIQGHQLVKHQAPLEQSLQISYHKAHLTRSPINE